MNSDMKSRLECDTFWNGRHCLAYLARWNRAPLFGLTCTAIFFLCVAGVLQSSASTMHLMPRMVTVISSDPSPYVFLQLACFLRDASIHRKVKPTEGQNRCGTDPCWNVLTLFYFSLPQNISRYLYEASIFPPAWLIWKGNRREHLIWENISGKKAHLPLSLYH